MVLTMILIAMKVLHNKSLTAGAEGIKKDTIHMLDIQKYQAMEAIEDLLDEYNLVIANLDADIALKALRILHMESKLKMRKPANAKRFGYLRIMLFKKAIHLNELRKLTYRHYRDGLLEKLQTVKQAKNEYSNIPHTVGSDAAG